MEKEKGGERGRNVVLWGGVVTVCVKWLGIRVGGMYGCVEVGVA